jgi:hypothetical protein
MLEQGAQIDIVNQQPTRISTSSDIIDIVIVSDEGGNHMAETETILVYILTKRL